MLACGVFQRKPRQIERLDGAGDLGRDRLGAADIKRSMRDLSLELLAAQGRPATRRADHRMHLLITREKLVAGLLVGLGDMTGRVNADHARFRAKLLMGAFVEIDKRGKPRRIAADDREHQVHLHRCGLNHRLRTAAHATPDPQRLLGARMHGDGFQRRAEPAFEADLFLRHKLMEQLGFFFEQGFVIIKRETEEREALGKGAPPDRDLGASRRQRIKRGEPLKHPDRIV